MTDEWVLIARVFTIPFADGIAAGLSPEKHVQVNEKYGGGWWVTVDGFHDLHCLVCSMIPCNR
jgi:hypothetical protein